MEVNTKIESLYFTSKAINYKQEKYYALFKSTIFNIQGSKLIILLIKQI